MADPYASGTARPLSVAIPRSFGAQGPYCPRRPHLSEILANESPPPWTLSAFMAYLSQNHCLETLEFTMDAARYGKHYAKMAGRLPGGVLPPSGDEADYLKMLWARLMDAYITPNGPREVNLPSEVRNGLLQLIHNPDRLPPPPNALDTAVQHIYALMEESVLVPFLNTCCPQPAHAHAHAHADSNANSSDENLAGSSSSRHMHSHSASAHPFSPHSYQERGVRYQGSNRRSSPLGGSSAPHISQSYSASSSSSSSSHANRASAPSTLTQLARGISVRHSGQPSRSTAPPPFFHPDPNNKSPSPASADSDPCGHADDSSLSSLSRMTPPGPSSHHHSSGSDVQSAGLHTPPTTPPLGDCQPYDGSPVDSSSPREGAWKRVGRSLGLRRAGRRVGSGSPDGAVADEDGWPRV